MNLSMLSGYVVEDNSAIQLRIVPDNQDEVTSFTIAVPRDDQGICSKDTADFITVVAWGKAAKFAVDELDKGMFIEVEGYIHTSRRRIRGIEKVIYKNGRESNSLSIPVFEINSRWIKMVAAKRS